MRRVDPAAISKWHSLDSVAVAVEQIAGADFHAADFDGFAEFDEVRIGVRDTDAAGEAVETQGFERRDIADGTVGDEADASERDRDSCVNFSEECAGAGRFIHVGEGDDLRSGYAGGECSHHSGFW